jgi:O-methyltransferase
MNMRTAYLDVLKLALCDLVSPHATATANRQEDGTVQQGVFGEDQLWIRRQGRDWPLCAVTMVGLDRLNDLQECVETMVTEGVQGDLIEAGAWRGGASMLMRATLNSMGEARTVWVADSFQGFRDSDGGFSSYLSQYEILTASLEDVVENFAHYDLEDGVRFLAGYFDETLSSLSSERWALIRLDSDMYESTKLSLEALYPNLSPGGFLILDDYFILPPVREAVEEYRAQQGITDPIVQVDWNLARWRRDL